MVKKPQSVDYNDYPVALPLAAASPSFLCLCQVSLVLLLCLI